MAEEDPHFSSGHRHYASEKKSNYVVYTGNENASNASHANNTTSYEQVGTHKENQQKHGSSEANNNLPGGMGGFNIDTVVITEDLKRLFFKEPSTHSPLFYSNANLPATLLHAPLSNWSCIQSSLKDLMEILSSNSTVTSSLLPNTIRQYSNTSTSASDFGVIENDELAALTAQVLPTIVKNALKLPERLRQPTSLLKSGENRTIYLTRNLSCSIIAHAFLCTKVPESCVPGLNKNFNFLSLYDYGSDLKSASLKAEKLKCFLEYFRQMERMPPTEGSSIISIERRCISNWFKWSTSKHAFQNLNVSVRGRIEDATGMLQVDFANRKIGGGVLRKGCYQEEIRFCISPELLCAILLTEQLDHDEVLVITGTKIFSSYTGYGSTFKYKQLDYDPWLYQTSKDYFGRETNEIVAMDAWNFKPSQKFNQYNLDKVNRDLHKTYVAFMKTAHSSAVATGNWGCGYFNGDPELKFLIQWMGATVNQRFLSYFVNDETFANDILEVEELLLKNRSTVADLYKILEKYQLARYSTKLPSGPPTLFEFIKRSMRSQRTRKQKSFLQSILDALFGN